jgi:hypothetical protein
MRYFIVAATGALAVLLLWTILPSSGARAFLDRSASASSCQQGWTVVPSPNPGHSHLLSDVAAVTSDDVWAVGHFRTGDDPNEQHALILHWNGTVWSVVLGPDDVIPPSALNGATAISSDDVWAVGQSLVGSGTSPLIIHWDGSAWSVSVVPSLNVGSSGHLSDVAAVAADDVWAVGYSFTSNSERGSLFMHWDGATWSVVLGPNLGSSVGSLDSVTAISSDDVWAVGNSRPADDLNEVNPLVMHWDGAVWSVVPSPNLAYDSDLRGIAAASSDDVWAVGASQAVPGSTALIMHWDGTAWSVAPTPSGSGFGIEDVAAVSADEVWGVGYHHTWRWDGTTWSVAPNALTGPGYAVTTVPNGPDRDVWVVGQLGGEGSNTLTARFCGPAVAETPTPTLAPSPTPVAFPATGARPGSHEDSRLTRLGAIMASAGLVFLLSGWSRTGHRKRW